MIDDEPQDPREYREPRRGDRHRAASRGSGRSQRPRAAERATLNPRAPRAPRAPRVRSERGAIAGARIAIPAIILLVIVGGIAFGVWNTFYRAASHVPAGRTVTVVVPEGASAAQVANLLASKGVVANAIMFRIRANSMGAADKLKPGEYRFVTGSGYEDVIKALAEGPQVQHVTFTIPEGWRIEAIAARVEAKFGIPASEFADLAETGAKDFNYPFLKDNPTKSLEGYLFPKTYTLEASATASDIINVMLAQYEKEVASLDFSYAESKNLTHHEVLTIASLIEREASVDTDRPKVSSVIYNRLRIGMRLQLCSTVQFALRINDPKLSLEQLKVDSPYNTYENAGLPPGPICSPGLASIKAALKPADTTYLYFVLTHKDGRHSFATNYDDFLRLKAQADRGLK